MSNSLGASVLGYVFPDNRQGMEFVLEKLTEKHFTVDGSRPETTQSTIFKILRSYGERYGEVFPGTYLVDLLKRNNIEQSKILLLQETYTYYCSLEVSEDQFHYAVDGLIDDFNQQQSGQIITTGFDIMERGVEIDGEFKKGYKEGNEYILNRLGDLDQQISEEAPEGDMRLEGASILEAYEIRESLEIIPGISFGIPSLDECTSGIQPGELAILAAFTNQGKSHFAVQLGHNACVHQGKPGYIATTETVRDATMIRILARHSREPQFGLPRGLDSKSIKNGTLTPDEKSVFYDVVKDFSSNSNYAPLNIVQIPRNGTLNYIEASAKRINRKGPAIDFIIIDYLQLIRSVRKRSSEREEFNELVREGKVLSTTFDGGRGVPVITPWQMSRDHWTTAAKSGQYTLASLSDTSEAEKSADIVMSLLRPNPTANEAFLQILKARGGPLMDPVSVNLDYRNSYIGEGAVPLETGVVDFTGGFDINTLLGVS